MTGGDLFADLRDISQTNTDRVARDGALHLALVDIGRQDADLMAPGIVGQDVGRVKPHRLVVEQGAHELGGVVVLEPGRLIGEDGEGGRVALGEAVLGKPEQFLEDLLGRGLIDALAYGACR